MSLINSQNVEGSCQFCQQHQAQYQDIQSQKMLCLQCIQYMQNNKAMAQETDLNTESTATQVSLNNIAQNQGFQYQQPRYNYQGDMSIQNQQADVQAQDQDFMVGNMPAPQKPPKGYQEQPGVNWFQMMQYQQMYRNSQQRFQVPYLMGYPYAMFPKNMADMYQNQQVYQQQNSKQDDFDDDFYKNLNNSQMQQMQNQYFYNNPQFMHMQQSLSQNNILESNQMVDQGQGRRRNKQRNSDRNGLKGCNDRYEGDNSDMIDSIELKKQQLRQSELKAKQQILMHQQLCEQYQTEEHLTRKERVQRYIEKKRNKRFQKFIRYESRKKHALIRPRIKGRFAKREEVEALKRLIESGRFRASKPMKYFLPDHSDGTDGTALSREGQEPVIVPQTDEQWNDIFNNLSDADWDTVLATM